MVVRKTLFKILLLWVCLAMIVGKAATQERSEIPPFSMTLSNGQYFNAARMPKGKPVLLIYFDPECEHCHTLMNSYFNQPALFENAEVVMVTFKPLSELQAFVQSYQVHKYPNIKVGTEGKTYYLSIYYRMQSMPFVALYNKNGKLIASYQKDVPFEALRKKLKQL